MKTIKELIKLEEYLNGPRVKAVIRGKVVILHEVLELIDVLARRTPWIKVNELIKRIKG